MKCFKYSQLIDFAEGVLNPPELQALLDHIASGCRRCQEETDLLKEMVSLMRADRAGEAPPGTLQAALGLFAKIRKTTGMTALRKEIVAILAFDSFQQPALAGTRNLKGLGKQLLFKAEGYDIDLRFSPTERTGFDSIIGQILQKETAAGVADAVVSFAADGREVLSTTTDTFGIFSFRNLPHQLKYDFKIAIPGLEIHIGDVSPA